MDPTVLRNRASEYPAPPPGPSPSIAPEDGAGSRAKGVHWLPQAPPTEDRPRPPPWEKPQGRALMRRTPGGLPVHPSACSPPGPAAAPAAARCSASPSPCGAARLGPAPTPRSPRRPPGPPSSAHVTAAGSPQTTLSATAGTHSHVALGAGPTRFRAGPRLRPRRPSSALMNYWRPDGAAQRLLPGRNTFLSGALSLHPEIHVPGSLQALETACKKAMLPAASLGPTSYLSATKCWVCPHQSWPLYLLH